MANPEHVDIVKRGSDMVYEWREKNPDTPLDLEGADLQRINLIQAKLDGAILKKANLSGAMLKNASLKEADLSKAVLVRANLTNANLQSAKLKESALNSAVLMRCNLNDADLSRAILTGTSFRGADLKGANLTDSNLKGAVLGTVGGEFGTAVYKAKNITTEQIRKAKGWEGAIYDEEFRKELGLPPPQTF
jgi:uncharacterized protein YjbI with pentapeptide repeats